MKSINYCNKCGEELPMEAIYCQKCGCKLVKNIFEKNKNIQNYNEFIPLWKFAFFSFISFGFYYVYWMYKSWKILRDKNNKDISPFWRAIFSPIFAGNLAGDSFEFVKQKDYPENDSHSSIIGVIFFISNIIDVGLSRSVSSQNISYPYNLITYIPFLIKIGILIPIVKSMNYFWLTDYPNLPEKKLTWWQILLIAISSIIAILVLLPEYIF